MKDLEKQLIDIIQKAIEMGGKGVDVLIAETPKVAQAWLEFYVTQQWISMAFGIGFVIVMASIFVFSFYKYKKTDDELFGIMAFISGLLVGGCLLVGSFELKERFVNIKHAQISPATLIYDKFIRGKQ